MNGKGDTYRPVNKKRFDKHYDTIFRCQCDKPAILGLLNKSGNMQCGTCGKIIKAKQG